MLQHGCASEEPACLDDQPKFVQELGRVKSNGRDIIRKTTCPILARLRSPRPTMERRSYRRGRGPKRLQLSNAMLLKPQHVSNHKRRASLRSHARPPTPLHKVCVEHSPDNHRAGQGSSWKYVEMNQSRTYFRSDEEKTLLGRGRRRRCG